MKVSTRITKNNFIPEYLDIFNSASLSIPNYGKEGDNFEVYQLALSMCDDIRGNSLLWFPQSSEAFKEEDLETKLKNYIQNTVDKYNKIKYWDVINELMAENGRPRIRTLIKDKYELHPITSISNWIDKLFYWVNEVNPEAELFINDYRPQNPLKWNAIFELIDNLRSRDVPIHGIGIQHHHHLPRAIYDGFFAWTQTRQVVREAKKRGLKVHFTETSIWTYPQPDSLSFLSSDIYNSIANQLQATAYKQLFECAIEEGVDHFNIWSYSDKYHWGYNINDKGAGIFDEEFNPKPAYWALKKLTQ